MTVTICWLKGICSGTKHLSEWAIKFGELQAGSYWPSSDGPPAFMTSTLYFYCRIPTVLVALWDMNRVSGSESCLCGWDQHSVYIGYYLQNMSKFALKKNRALLIGTQREDLYVMKRWKLEGLLAQTLVLLAP